MSDEDAVDLGLCCACQERPATGLALLNRRGPVSGKGWGCIVCGLPPDGAVAALCDDCAEVPPRFVCVGYAREGRRMPLADLPLDPFEHDPAKHPEMGE